MVPSFTVFWGARDVRNVSWENSEKIIISGELPIVGITGLNDIDKDNNLDFAVVAPYVLYTFSYNYDTKNFYNSLVNINSDSSSFGQISNSFDINVDENNDFIVGVRKWEESNVGNAWLYFGTTDFNLNRYVEVTTSDSVSSFGGDHIAISENFISKNKNGVAFGITSIMSGLSEFDRKGYLDIYTYDVTTEVIYENINGNKYKLQENYPNPFNPTTVIEYQIPKESFVNLSVYNALGKKIETLVNEKQKTGKYKTSFTAENLPSGIYLINLTANDYKKTIKSILIK